MKKYIIATLCIVNSLTAMEEEIKTYTPNVEQYIKGNKTNTLMFEHFLKQSNINYDNKKILSIESGYSNIESIMAEKASFIDAFSCNQEITNLVTQALSNNNKILFQCSTIEKFEPKHLYDLTIIPASANTFSNLESLFSKINKCLNDKGELFFSILTKEDPTPCNLKAAKKLIPGWIKSSYASLGNKPLNELIGCYRPSRRELQDKLTETGFEIIKNEQQLFNLPPMTQQDIENGERCIIFRNPIMDYMPAVITGILFEQYINECLSQLKPTDDEKFLTKIIVTIIHARKKIQ